jgi:hypothetical protein
VSAPVPSAPSAELRARVLDAVRNDAVPSRAAGARRRAIVIMLGFTVMFALGAAGGGPQLRGRPIGYVLALIAAWLPLAAMATWAGVARGRSMLGRPASWRLVVAVVTPAALLATWLAVALAWPATLRDMSGAHSHFVCIRATIVLAVGPLVAFVLVGRGSDAVSPRLGGAAMGAAAGAWGAAALPLFCGFTSPLHIALGHVLPVALVAAFGALLGERFLSIRRARANRA